MQHMGILIIFSTIIKSQNDRLITQVTMEKIEEAIGSMHQDKALGLDGFLGFFFY